MRPDDLATVTTCASEFEAHALVAVLKSEGIEAHAFGAARSALPIASRWLEVPVQVRAADVERARAVLERNKQDSIDIDWDEVDVGEREDSLPLSTVGRVPLMARVATITAWGLIALLLISAALALAWRILP
jgi:hypothetical protein